jgi:DNA-binding CsgD family transcriptional regulator
MTKLDISCPVTTCDTTRSRDQGRVRRTDLDEGVADSVALVTDFAALIEAAYETGGSDADWLRRIVAFACAGLDRGCGVVGCLFQVQEQGAPSVTAVVGVGPLQVAPETVAQTHLGTLVERAASSRGGTICGTARAPAIAAGIRECVGIVTLGSANGTRAGCALLAPLPRAERAPRAFAAIWSSVALHLEAGRRLRGGPCQEDLVWRGLLSGRWDVVDHFDADGRRFIIGRRCPSAQATPVASLTDRERTACSAAAFGQSNKVIAAEMGIAVSTAGMLLLRATRKLRCASREELIRVFRLAEESWGDDRRASEKGRATRDREPLVR